MNILLKSCRICLQTLDLLNIFERNYEEIVFVKIWEKIVYCASVQISEEDALPKMICKQCLQYLDIAYNFKSTCSATDRKLRDSLNNHKNDTIDNDIFGQVLQVEMGEKYTENCDKQNDNFQLDDSEILIEERTVNPEAIIPNVTNYQYKSNEEANNMTDKQMILTVNKNLPKGIFKVGRHIAKKNSGKFPQKLQASINDEKPDRNNSLKDGVLLNDINYGNICHFSSTFEDILESDLPAVGFEETVETETAFSYNNPCNYHKETNNFELRVFDRRVTEKNSYKLEEANRVNLRKNKSNKSKEMLKCKPKVIGLVIGTTLRHNKTESKIRDFATKKKGDSFIKKTKQIFKCHICSKVFSFKSHFDRHSNTHTGMKKYSCKYCQRKFINSYNLGVHMLKHTGDFPLKCQVCGRGFPNPSLLKRHGATHTSQANFQCRYCSVKLRQSSSLKLHERMHLHRPSYQCDVCYKAFSYTSSLAAHKKQHYSTKRYNCDSCSSTFSRKSSLIRHIEGHHRNKRVKCKVCGVIFNNKASYGSHLKNHHKYKCDVCDENFQQKTKLISHMKTHR